MRSLFVSKFIIALSISLFALHAAAQAPAPAAAATDNGTNAQFAIVKDLTTGQVLFEKDSDKQMVPSSMTKMMTLYITFENLKNGKIKLTDTFPVSEKAWRIQGSKMFVELGNKISVDDLIHGVAVQSGNDACVVLAEGIAASEEAFAVMMNETAKRLGMNESHFRNSNGWPEEGHVVSARDLATLAQHIIQDFPEYYPLFSKTSFTYHGISQGNRNLLLYKNIGVDGLKTGHTEAAGYGITVSGKRGNRRLVVVVNGMKSEKARAEEASRLLEYGFNSFENYQLFSKDVALGQANVWYGKKSTVGLAAKEEVTATLPRATAEQKVKEIKATIHYEGPIKTPIQAGAKLAELELEMPGQPSRIIPLYATETVEPLTFTERILRSLHLMAK
jgi:D-alanyl-D-alanine carboxypeptidase (penicillin-binding protein 5/6)